jgi:hypothetical protein
LRANDVLKTERLDGLDEISPAWKLCELVVDVGYLHTIALETRQSFIRVAVVDK